MPLATLAAAHLYPLSHVIICMPYLLSMVIHSVTRGYLFPTLEGRVHGLGVALSV